MKVKMFRVDCEDGIQLERWVELVSFFYRGNEMLLDYLNPQQFDAAFGERARSRLPRELLDKPKPD